LDIIHEIRNKGIFHNDLCVAFPIIFQSHADLWEEFKTFLPTTCPHLNVQPPAADAQLPAAYNATQRQSAIGGVKPLQALKEAAAKTRESPSRSTKSVGSFSDTASPLPPGAHGMICFFFAQASLLLRARFSHPLLCNALVVGSDLMRNTMPVVRD